MNIYALLFAVLVTLTLPACAKHLDTTERPEGISEFETPLAGPQDIIDTYPGTETTGANIVPQARGVEGNLPLPASLLIEESDIYKVEGAILYLLNRYRGLQIFDVSNLDQPTMIGRVAISGMPREMFIRDARAYILVNDDYRFNAEVAPMDLNNAYISRLRIVDLSNRSLPTILGTLDIEEDIQDARIVGNVIYLVSHQYSWQNRATNKTQILSVLLSDPANIRIVDVKDFLGNDWENHILVTQEAIYLASSQYDSSSEYQTRIQYVDIRDPTGIILLRGEVSVPGSVQARWAMDEYNGVLRVASGQTWGNGDIHLTTFDVTHPEAITKLGHYTLNIDETLTAVRFDKTRGYLVSYRNIDPLFTFDLTDPANPKLLGGLEMTGWLDFIVPMGDTLIALGHEERVDPQTRQRKISLAVSLFDVSNQTAPKLLSRVDVGEDWGWVPGRPDDFAKIFKVLPELGLILLPFQSWNSTAGSSASGVQLIDYNPTSLVKRGLIRDTGWVERGVAYSTSTVFTLSSERFQILDITDRALPRLRGRLELARNVSSFALIPGSHAVQLSEEGWQNGITLTVTPLDDPDTPIPVSRLHLSGSYGRLFINEAMAYVVSVRFTGSLYDRAQVQVDVVDLTDPRTPVLRGHLDLTDPNGKTYGWSPIWGNDVTQINGSTLVFHQFWYYTCYGDCLTCPKPTACDPNMNPGHILYFVDLANPMVPGLASSIKLDGAYSVGDLKTSGTTVYLSESKSYSREDGWHTRYYLRRINAADPAHPVVMPGVNIPGIFTGQSSDGVYIYTLEKRWDVVTGTSKNIFHALALLENRAYLRSSVEVEGSIRNVIVKSSGAFMTAEDWNVPSLRNSPVITSYPQTFLNVIDLANPRALRLASKTLLPYRWPDLITVEKERAFFRVGYGIVTYFVGNLDAPVFAKFFPVQGWPQEIVGVGNRIFVPSGFYGVPIFQLGNA